jgi:ankyrin repeat protein
MMDEMDFKFSLREAVFKNYVTTIRKLIRQGRAAGYSIDVSVAGFEGRYRTALHEAAALGEPKTCAVLLEFGASVTVQDYYGREPLGEVLNSMASHRDRLPIVEMLLERGASGHCVERNGLTPLHHAITAHAKLANKVSSGTMRNGLATNDDMLHVTRLLMKSGANPDFVPEAAESRYLTPFQLAVEQGLVSQVRLFVEEFGVDWTQKTLSKKTMRLIAGSDEIRELLLSYKAGAKVVSALAGASDAPVQTVASDRSMAL